MPTTQIAMRVSLATRASSSASPASQLLIGRNYLGEHGGRMTVMLERQEWRQGVERRAAAGLALVLGAATPAPGLYVVVQQFPRGLIVLASVRGRLTAGWYGLLRTRVVRLRVARRWRWWRSPYRSCSC